MADVERTQGTASPLSLADKYDLAQNRIFVSGPQAIVRLLLMQAAIDRRDGLTTAGFISGYRGSPLGGLDLNFLRAKKALTARDIIFEPGLNEDLAATAIWGAQQAEMRGEGRFDGVFGLWYGKGPGVDRSGDVFRHVNLAGTSRNGGVLALMGDDHTAESSSTAHQSEFTFVAMMMPILAPAGVQELIDYGLYGYALSRYSGCWVGIKCLKDTVESTASVDASLDRVRPVVPTDFILPAGGLNIRPNDPVLAQERRLQNEKFPAVLAWLRANKLNRIITSGGGPPAKLGIVASGKSYLDVRQALDELGIDEVRANALGLRLYKIGCPWPLEPQGLRTFAQGLDKIIVVEEKRSLIENQLRDELYGSAHQPVCVGKKDEKGRQLFPVAGALDVNDIAIAIGRRLLDYHPDAELESRVAHIGNLQFGITALKDAATRTPYFCSGCPHNVSTKVPEGMRAYAGIGCHYMVQNMDRATEGYTHMGGEGANWVGEALFSTRSHIIQNLGDGTYNHSGVLAIRWAVAARTNITFKILFNDAVAMTGGQALEGELTVPKLVRQVAAEGAKKIAVITDAPTKYRDIADWPRDVEVYPREDLEPVQRELAEVPGTTILIYDQTCAAEKRRRRKRKEAPEPDKRVFINDLVCEGCGDCGVTSNCVSVQPLETEFGRKRVIDQSSCNKDFSCLNGFCPAMVTVEGAKPKVPGTKPAANDFPPLPQPNIPEIGDRPFAILIAGVGGTGVVTIGAFLAMAAHLEGKFCGSTDMAGLAQKGGAVHSHIKIAAKPDQIHAIGVGTGGADLVIGCDLVVSGSAKVLATVRPGETGVVINNAETYPGDFTRNPDFTLPVGTIRQAIEKATGGHASFCDATSRAVALVGTSVAANIFLVGFAWQKGLLPLSEDALMRAIEIVGESVEMNKRAFLWGRREAAEPARVATLLAPKIDPNSSRAMSETFGELFSRRQDFLTAYQNRAYADLYGAKVKRVIEAEQRVAQGETRLATVVAKSLFKLMSVKDEFEVARLYSDGTFHDNIAAAFDGDIKIKFHLAPPIFAAKRGPMPKWTFGPWMMRLFKILAPLKILRGTPLDLFGLSGERRMERQLLAAYEATLDEIVVKLTSENYDCAVALAALPGKIRGFGHIKFRAVELAKAEEAELLARFRSDASLQPMKLAAE